MFSVLWVLSAPHEAHFRGRSTSTFLYFAQLNRNPIQPWQTRIPDIILIACGNFGRGLEGYNVCLVVMGDQLYIFQLQL